MLLLGKGYLDHLTVEAKADVGEIMPVGSGAKQTVAELEGAELM